MVRGYFNRIAQYPLLDRSGQNHEATVRHSLLLLCLCFVTLSTLAQDRNSTHPVKVLPPSIIERNDKDALKIRTGYEEEPYEYTYLEHLSTLYGYQSDLMAAESRNDEDAVVFILEQAIADLGEMLLLEDVVADTRFSHIYSILVDEYERVYGPSETLFAAFGDIYEVQKAIFAELEKVKDPLLEDVIPSGMVSVGTDVEMTMNRLVESSMEFLLQKRRDTLLGWISRADTYFPMVEKIFAEEGVPDELKYLAMIESGLVPRARSWASAVGLWQFIPATGRAYGLNVNAWVDDRMDPELATRAAAKHLKDLYRQYGGDWQIALAGYNCSPRCIKRAMASSGKSNPTFWDMYPYLPAETRNYVPSFIATSLITSNPESFGLVRKEEGPQYTYSVVPVTGMISLSDIAKMAQTDVATIKALNPNLRRESLPPTKDIFYLRIPLGTYDSFVAAYSVLPETAKRPSGEYIVKRGDTLSAIGAQFEVSVAQLMDKNALKSSNLRIGQRLVVPFADYSSSLPEAQFAELSQTVVQYPRRLNRPIVVQQTLAAQPSPVVENSVPVQQTSLRTTSADTESKPTPPPSEKPKDVKITYRVRSGDTLSGIADSHKVSISSLRGWNDISGSKINVGQRLTIYTDGREAPKKADEPITYRVKRGDTLGGIASKNNVTVSQLRQWNKIKGSNIRIDQQITIYAGQAQTTTHVVKSGDTLIGIGQQYGVSVANIKEWNQINSNTIRVGQQIKIIR